MFQGGSGEAAATEEKPRNVLISNSVESYDVPLARLLMNKEKNQRKIEALIQQRNEIQITFARIQTALTQYFNVSEEEEIEIELDCYFSLVSSIHQHCYNLGENSFALRKLKSLGMYCENQEFSNFTLEKRRKEMIQEKIEEVCTDRQQTREGNIN